MPKKKGVELPYHATSKVPFADGKETWTSKFVTHNVLNYCLPISGSEDLNKRLDAIKRVLQENPVAANFNDMYLSSRAMFISCGMSVVYSFVFIYLMSAFAETIAWICVVLA